MGIGTQINARLAAIGMTQAVLAEKLGTSETTVSHWSTGKFQPGARYLAKLAAVLETTTSYLNGETDNPDAIEIRKKTTIPVQGIGDDSQPPKEKVTDYSLKMGNWGIAIERRLGGGQIKIEADARAGQKVKSLLYAIWEKFDAGTVLSPSDTPADRKRTDIHMLIEQIDESRLDEAQEAIKEFITVHSAVHEATPE